MAFPMAAALLGGSVVSGLFGASSANRAADAQAEGIEKQIDFQRDVWNQQRADTIPWRDYGQDSLNALRFEMGLGPRPGTPGAAGNALGEIETINSNPRRVSAGYSTRGGRNQWDDSGGGLRQQFRTEYDTSYKLGDQTFGSMEEAKAAQQAAMAGGDQYRGFQNTPGFGFALEQNQKALDRQASARGMRLSGAAMADAGRLAQGMQNQEYGNFLNRLSMGAGMGQTAVGSLNAAGAQAGQNIGNAYAQQGQVRASGYNGVNNALQGTLGNMYNIAGMQAGGYFK